MTREHPLPGTQPVTIGVIGAGRVGRAVTAAAVTDGLADAVLVHSRRSVEATALAADAADLAATQHAPTRVDAVEHVRELHACSVIVVCVRARFTNPTVNRATGLTANTPLIAELARQLVDYDNPILMVTNPVDVMSRLFAAHSSARVYGVGSNLDSARFRGLVAAHLRCPTRRGARISARRPRRVRDHLHARHPGPQRTGRPARGPDPEAAHRTLAHHHGRHRPHPARSRRRRTVRAAQARRAGRGP